MDIKGQRILFLIDDLGPGGAQRQIVSLSRSFSSRGAEISILTYSSNSFFKEILIKYGIQVFELKERKLIKRIIKVRKSIRNGEYNTVLSFLGPSNLLNVISSIPRKKWKVIVCERSTNPIILRSLKSRVIRFSYLFADLIISNSNANIVLVRRANPFLAERKFKVIYNLIDLEKFKPLRSYKVRANDVLTIVISASFRRLKNPLNLIKAVSLLTPDEKKRVLIKWYGDKTPGKHLDSVINEAVELINRLELNYVIQLLPLNHDIVKVLQYADVIGLFSFFEGLPNSVCEGMAVGKPIIASEISDIPLLIKDGINGKLCNPSDIYSIADAIRYFINIDNDKLQNMGRLNRTNSIELFDWETNTSKYLELLI